MVWTNEATAKGRNCWGGQIGTRGREKAIIAGSNHQTQSEKSKLNWRQLGLLWRWIILWKRRVHIAITLDGSILVESIGNTTRLSSIWDRLRKWGSEINVTTNEHSQGSI